MTSMYLYSCLVLVFEDTLKISYLEPCIKKMDYRRKNYRQIFMITLEDAYVGSVMWPRGLHLHNGKSTTKLYPVVQACLSISVV